ncbi:MAG: alpha amylase C-terminal domain-containing protein [Leptospiraceae bacterium]|nr:alpha amylase C-terminal domain-containing protein [Leptospiraceae bacterium]MCP5497910.1 alpha amylase C-terminal domain-containing protein [Leptospiraceae bacterium]
MNDPVIIKNDPWLNPFKDAINRRIDNAIHKEKELTQGKTLKEFSAGHEYFGLHKKADHWVFREWAPNAEGIYLFGDFTKWQVRNEFALKRLDNGVWEIKIPLNAIEHGQLYHLFLYWKGGEGHRIPSYARRVVQDPQTYVFNAQVWYPDKPYQWKNPPFQRKNEPPLIYEAHVGMADENGKVATYEEFRTNVLHRVIKAGYNTIQFMAIQEHPYYGSFGYHVSNYFAASSRFGTPDELKALIDECHTAGISVIMDIVHSHAVKNEVEGLSRFDGTLYQYFHDGPKGDHIAWDSRCFNYGKNEVIHFLLSNCQFWMDEYRFDGFRFDGVTSMLYFDHGLSRDFTSYSQYYDSGQDEEAITYLTLANKLIHQVNPSAITIAEEMSGMPGLSVSIESGGMGFDYRLAMGVPDYWIKLIKEKKDDDWHVGNMFHELSSHRWDEKTINYAESHDQALVGDKTIIFRLIDKDMYWDMHVAHNNMNVDRGLALHRMIRMITISTAGGGYLNFMGNEFGHPEWIDFPRQGNNWSYHHARRQWSLVDNKELRYKFLSEFDRDMINLVKQEGILEQNFPHLIFEHVSDQVLIFERKGLIFIFNFHPTQSYPDYAFETLPGEYKIVLNSDSGKYGGHQRIDDSIPYRPYQAGENWYHLKVYIPNRTGFALKRVGL